MLPSFEAMGAACLMFIVVPVSNSAFAQVVSSAATASIQSVIAPAVNDLNTSLAVPQYPLPGDSVPDLVFEDLSVTGTIRLPDYRGKVVCLEFWASWCLPCMPALSDNDALIARRSDWKDRAVLISVSVDKTSASASRRIKLYGWSNIRHLWSPYDPTSRESQATLGFGVVELPYYIILNPDSTIAWRGMGSTRELEQRIDALLDSP